MKQPWLRRLSLAVITLGLWTMLNILALIFPDPAEAVTDAVGPVVLLVGMFGILVVLGALWNDYWDRRFRDRR